MKGFVPTPPKTVDMMVERLFKRLKPRKDARLLDPGCGHGAFIEGVVRWCSRKGLRRPEIVGIDQDASKLRQAKKALAGEPSVTLIHGNFLTQDLGTFDYIIGNPPYVGIEELSEHERRLYRELFATARGRFDLYLLFWERALKLLRPAGRIVFITPEKYTYVETARPLRDLLSRFFVDELVYAPEDTFPGLTTYPVVTTVTNRRSKASTQIRLRNGDSYAVRLPATEESWQPIVNKSPDLGGAKTLANVAIRVSCGVATGADAAYVFPAENLPAGCDRFLRPAIGGRELRLGSPLPAPRRRLLMPYDNTGKLLPLERLGAAAEYLHRPPIRRQLEARTCVARKPWYAFHETPPVGDMLRPKLLCKDIGQEPYFWIDSTGEIVPLHSTYYIVPSAPALLEPLAAFLNSPAVACWLRANCQRAANNFVRIQSTVLKRLPVPDEFFVESRAN